MSKKGQAILIWVLIVIGLGAIVLGIYAVVITPSEQVGENVETLVTKVATEEPKRGDESAKVMLVEYSDFQCPACKYFYNMVKKLKKERGDKVQFVFRHFPLQQHQYARIAAIAAEAAGKQGKFWEMHDVLFEMQDEWSKNADIQQSMIGYATAIGLDVNKFIADIQTKDIADKIERDVAEGTKQGIQGTPTFYLNGKLVQFRSYEELQQLVDAELNK